MDKKITVVSISRIIIKQTYSKTTAKISSMHQRTVPKNIKHENITKKRYLANRHVFDWFCVKTDIQSHPSQLSDHSLQFWQKKPARIFRQRSTLNNPEIMIGIFFVSTDLTKSLVDLSTHKIFPNPKIIFISDRSNSLNIISLWQLFIKA